MSSTAHSPTAHSHGRLLLGREAEVALVHRFLAGAAQDGRALLLTGPAGIGRTALLDVAAATALASGAFVVRAAGSEDGADLPSTGPARLLGPIGSTVDLLAPDHRAVLSTVLDAGPAGGAPPGDPALAAALVAVLEAGAGDRPAVVVVDDLPALDDRSARCLRLLARSLPGHRIGLLASAGTESGDPDLPEHRLGPLDDAAATALLAVLAPGLPPAARHRVLREAAGNPRALWTTWSWAQVQELPRSTYDGDIHCVTGWSKLGMTFRGVSVDALLDAAGLRPDAAFATAHSHTGYTTNLTLADLTGGRAWVVFEADGRPLTREHGGPARLLVPHLYFWKSAKWVSGLALTAVDQPGFWERNGYHDRGDPWLEQRYQGDR